MHGHIIVVEDDPDLRLCLSEILRAEGYQIQEAASGTEAMALLESGNSPDLILSDYLMRNGSGLELLRYVKSHALNPVFFMMTGQSEVQGDEAKRMGVNEFILKPFDVPYLLGCIDQYLGATRRSLRASPVN